MATPQTVSAVTTIEKIEQTFLNCPICYDTYKQPKCLPCLHTFCANCLGSYIESQEVFGAKRKMGFPCPICKQFVFVKSSSKPLRQWVDDIQNNFLIQNMIDCIFPKSGSTSSDQQSEPVSSGVSAPPPEPEISVTPPRPRPVPSAPPLSLRSNTSRLSPSAQFQSSRGNSRLLPAPVTGYQWDVLNRGHGFPDPVADTQWSIRSARSTENLSPSAITSLTASNLFWNRSNSSNDLDRDETVVLFVETIVPWRLTYGTRQYRKAQFSDVCYLPKRFGIVATDYNRCKVLLFEALFQRQNSPVAVKVSGRPCSVDLVDKDEEQCVVVNLQNKNVLIFISVPDMKIIREVKTNKNYRGVAVLSRNTLLAGSADRPACISLIEIDYSYRITKDYTLVQNGHTWDLSSPTHLCVLSPTMFMVSDSGKNSLICYDIDENFGTKTARKRYKIAPTRDRKFRSPGGLHFDSTSGFVYTVDYGNHAVLQIRPGDTIFCETLLTATDGVYKPSSVCMGPNQNLCVVDWEGRVCVYKESTVS